MIVRKSHREPWGLDQAADVSQTRAMTHSPGVFISVSLSSSIASNTEAIPISMKCRQRQMTERLRGLLALPIRG